MTEGMTIAVTADSHLGRRYPTMEFRERDICSGFEAALDGIISAKPDLIIHAGDLFDAVFPPGWIFEMGLSSFQSLPLPSDGCSVTEQVTGQQGSPNVFIIHGNHDGTADARCESGCFSILRYFDSMSLCNYLDLRRADETIYLPRYVCEAGGVTVGIQGLGHRPTSHFEKILGEVKPIPNVEHNILIVHQGIADLTAPYTRGDILPKELFLDKGFDLVIAGHTHRSFYEEVRGTRFLVPGSTERIDSGEFGERKGHYLLSVSGQDIQCEFRPIDLDRVRKVRRYDVEVDGLAGNEITEQCINAITDSDLAGALIYFVLRGQTPHGHADVDRAGIEARLSDRGPIAVKINTEKVIRKDIGEIVSNENWSEVRIGPDTFRVLFSERNLRDLAGNPIRDETVISILAQIAYNIYRAFERDQKEDVESILAKDLYSVAESFYPEEEER